MSGKSLLRLALPGILAIGLSGCGLFNDCPIFSNCDFDGSRKVGNSRIYSINGSGRNGMQSIALPGLPDMQRDGSGELKTSDTPKNFQRWKQLAGIYIRYETDGSTPPDPRESWRAYWSRNLDIIRQRQLNPDKYVNYVIATRRTRGLPEM